MNKLQLPKSFGRSLIAIVYATMLAAIACVVYFMIWPIPSTSSNPNGADGLSALMHLFPGILIALVAWIATFLFVMQTKPKKRGRNH